MDDSVTLPTKRVDYSEPLQERLTDNAYDSILPARYAVKNENGNVVEDQEELFERVAKNVAVAEAVHTDEVIAVEPQHIKPGHPSREELLEEVFGDFWTQGAGAPLSEENAKYVSYDALVDDLPPETEKRVRGMAEGFKRQMGKLSFIPNSPTLMNAGDDLQQLSACFTFSPDDDIDEIHETAKKAAKIFQSGGGMGYGFWKLRPYGDVVESSGGIASGPLSFMQTFDQMCGTIAQGGTRRGAQMGVMRVSHPDVPFFIHAKNKDVSLAKVLKLNDPDDYRYTSFSEAIEEARSLMGEDGKVPDHLRNAAEGYLSNFNISVGITDEFMEAVHNNEDYTFINPQTGEPHIATEETKELYSWFDLGKYVEVGEVLEVPANLIWDRIISGAHENGEPGVIYMDNVHADHGFDVESTPDASGGKHEILTTNPCLAGDMEVAVADGRESVPIEELAEEEDETLVYSKTEEGNLTVSEGCNARKTATDKDIYRVSTDGNSAMRLTEDHPVWVNGKGWTEVQDLHPGDSLNTFTRYRNSGNKSLHSTAANHKVDSIEKVGVGDVYDLTVEGTHNFYAGVDTEEGEEKHTFFNVHNCGEQPMQEYEACNLGHINLSTIAEEERLTWDEYDSASNDMEEDVAAFLNQAVDWQELRFRARIGTRFLDNVITMSDFPVEEIEQTVEENRKIGLGIMGLAQLYVQLGVEYGSEVGNEVARQLMTEINQESKYASHMLAQSRGAFDAYEESKWSDPEDNPEWFERHTGLPAKDFSGGFEMRNYSTTTIAPTGTTSMVGNTTGGCEPMYNVAYYKNVSDDVQGDEMLVEFDDYFLRVLRANDVDVEAVKKEAEELMEENDFDGVEDLQTVPDTIGKLFVTTNDVSARGHAAVQCALQEGVDSSISKTVNAPSDSTVEDAKEVFEFIHANGGKAVTFYRDGSRSKQVLTTRADNSETNDLEVEEGVEKAEKIADLAEGDEEVLQEAIEAVRFAGDDGKKICPECGEGELEPGEGCSICRNCGFSPCK